MSVPTFNSTEKVMNETAATGEVMYANEEPYTNDVLDICLAIILRLRTLRKTLRRWWGRLEKRRMATTESGGDETGDETGGPGDETGGDGW